MVFNKFFKSKDEIRFSDLLKGKFLYHVRDEQELRQWFFQDLSYFDLLSRRKQGTIR